LAELTTLEMIRKLEQGLGKMMRVSANEKLINQENSVPVPGTSVGSKILDPTLVPGTGTEFICRKICKKY